MYVEKERRAEKRRKEKRRERETREGRRRNKRMPRSSSVYEEKEEVHNHRLSQFACIILVISNTTNGVPFGRMLEKATTNFIN